VSLPVGGPGHPLALSTRLAQGDPRRYLRLNPGPGRQRSQSRQAPSLAPQRSGCVQSFWGAFMMGSTRALSAFMVASGHVNTTLSHRAGITSSLRRVSREDRGRALGFHRNASSRPIHSTWRPTFTGAS
jgi:hypothetical protein